MNDFQLNFQLTLLELNGEGERGEERRQRKEKGERGPHSGTHQHHIAYQS